MPTAKSVEYQTVEFATSKLFERWLAKHYGDTQGIWLRFYKKNSGVRSVTYAEALDVALCYGWIDGQVKRESELAYLQKFTPRRARSMWSKINRQHIVRLTEEGRMKAPGLAEVERAKADGRWDNAYDSAATMTEPDDFLKAIKKSKSAYAFYKTLNAANRTAILMRIQTAIKPETRARRIMKFVEMCANGEKLY